MNIKSIIACALAHIRPCFCALAQKRTGLTLRSCVRGSLQKYQPSCHILIFSPLKLCIMELSLFHQLCFFTTTIISCKGPLYDRYRSIAFTDCCPFNCSFFFLTERASNGGSLHSYSLWMMSLIVIIMDLLDIHRHGLLRMWVHDVNKYRRAFLSLCSDSFC